MITETNTVRPDDPIDIHTHFGLTYANYLVLHRTLMQSMPLEWQHRMTTCLRELDEAFAHVEQPEAFEIEPGEEREVEDLDESERKRARISREWDGDEEDGEFVYYDKNANQMESWFRVVVPKPDPVPHYNRGRTFIEPYGGGSETGGN